MVVLVVAEVVVVVVARPVAVSIVVTEVELYAVVVEVGAAATLADEENVPGCVPCMYSALSVVSPIIQSIFNWASNPITFLFALSRTLTLALTSAFFCSMLNPLMPAESVPKPWHR